MRGPPVGWVSNIPPPAESEGGITFITELFGDANCELLGDVGWKRDLLQEMCADWPFAPAGEGPDDQ